eukprot:3688471-Lingulodinium_polyedra.AAC.1
MEGNRSQQGYVVVLATPDNLNAETCRIHPIWRGPKLIKRMCRSTLMVATFAMSKGTEYG